MWSRLPSHFAPREDKQAAIRGGYSCFIIIMLFDGHPQWGALPRASPSQGKTDRSSSLDLVRRTEGASSKPADCVPARRQEEGDTRASEPVHPTRLCHAHFTSPRIQSEAYSKHERIHLTATRSLRSNCDPAVVLLPGWVIFLKTELLRCQRYAHKRQSSWHEIL